MRTQPTTLFGSLRKTYLTASLTAGLAACISLAIIAIISLHSLAQENLRFIARSIAYSSEAAVMFSDAETAYEILEQIANQEALIEASIETIDGSILARYAHIPATPLDTLGALLSRLIFPDHTTAIIRSGTQTLGYVHLMGSGNVFVIFSLKILTAIMISLIIAVCAAAFLARQAAQRLARQLDALASFTHKAHITKDFKHRLPNFRVLEFDQLGKDFNALLTEIENKNAELIARQTELEHANATLSLLALHDSLTGLANRTQFENHIAHAIEEARINNHALGLLYIDTDHFKDVNDHYGHTAGDALLIEIAQRISSIIRDSDLVARLGGDEFGIILAPLHYSGDAEIVASKILQAMIEPIAIGPNGEQIQQGLSIGIALFPTHAHSSESLIRAADYAMYLAKSGGRNNYCIFDAKTDRRIHKNPM